jgi:hypothetical protein
MEGKKNKVEKGFVPPSPPKKPGEQIEERPVPTPSRPAEKPGKQPSKK